MEIFKECIMKTAIKIITSLLVLILVISICSFGVIAFTFGTWLQTYQAFTKEELVAEITINRIEPEGDFSRMRVEYRPVTHTNALDLLFGIASDDVETEVTVYEIYGDQVIVGGPVVKFNNIPTLLGFETIHKVARIQGSYLDIDLANRIPEGNVYELNGGIDETWAYFEEQSEELDWLIDTAYFSMAGKSVQRTERVYGLYITEDGYILDIID